MPIHFFTRRTYDAGRDKFNNNLAALTRYVTLDRARPNIGNADLRDAQSWVADVLATANGGPIVCFVHGYNMDQMEMLDRLTKIDAQLRAKQFNGAVIGFDWPSKGTTAQYFTDRNTAKAVAPYLVAEGLGLFMNTLPRDAIHVIAHSMGALLTLRGFSQVGDAGTTRWGVGQVAFVAADNEADDMARGRGLARTMADRAQRVTNYHSNQDAVLVYSQNLPGNGDRLGFSGMPTPVEDTHVDVYCGRRFADSIPKPPGSGLVREKHSHTWYFDDADGFYADLKPTLDGVSEGNMGNTRGFVPGTGDQALL